MSNTWKVKLISNLLCDCHDLSLDKSYGKGNGQFLSYWMKTKISEGHVYWKYTRNCSFKKLQFNILIQILSLGPPFFSPFFFFSFIVNITTKLLLFNILSFKFYFWWILSHNFHNFVDFIINIFFPWILSSNF